MDTDTFEKIAVADPENRDETFLLAQNRSADRRRQVERQRHFDATIRQVTRAVDVPEGLAGRILLNQDFSRRHENQRRVRMAYAAAVGVFFIAAIAFQTVLTPPGLDDVVLKHIYDELHHLQDRHDVPMPKLNELIGGFGGRFVESPGQVNYAGLCKIRKSVGMHLVVASAQGPVSVFIMPDEYLSQHETVGDAHFNGLLLPSGPGSIAVVGEATTTVDKMANHLQRIIRWDS